MQKTYKLAQNKTSKEIHIICDKSEICLCELAIEECVPYKVPLSKSYTKFSSKIMVDTNYEITLLDYLAKLSNEGLKDSQIRLLGAILQNLGEQVCGNCIKELYKTPKSFHPKKTNKI